MMEGKLDASQTAGTLSQLTPEKLLLLGLQLLSKNSAKVPCAVVQPRLQSKCSNEPGSPPSPVKVKEAQSNPSSPQQQVPTNGRKRKRGGSSELTETEKREKRKLMNRVAAQTARDRKKNFVMELEKKVAMLETKNRELQEENQVLRKQTEILTTEKHQLEKQLRLQDSPLLTNDWLQPLEKESHSESGSAVPITSLQQKQILKAFLTHVLAILSLIHWLTSCKDTCQNLSPHMEHMIQWMESHSSHMTTSWLDNQPPLRKPAWWGAAQSTWNPPAN